MEQFTACAYIELLFLFFFHSTLKSNLRWLGEFSLWAPETSRANCWPRLCFQLLQSRRRLLLAGLPSDRGHIFVLAERCRQFCKFYTDRFEFPYKAGFPHFPDVGPRWRTGGLFEVRTSDLRGHHDLLLRGVTGTASHKLLRKHLAGNV